MKQLIWSFSSLKTFQQCPKKYYHTKVAKDVIEGDTTATLYGKEMHTVAEEYIRDSTPIPEKFAYVKSSLDRLNAIPGEKHCEVKLGLTKDLQPCEFSAEGVWWHGIADLVILDREKKLAYSVDYKTSKNARYADMGQLDLIAAALFAKYPEIERVKSALMFVVSKEFVKAEHDAKMKSVYVQKVLPDIERLEGAFMSGVWNPKTGPLCKWCSVKQCEYNKG